MYNLSCINITYFLFLLKSFQIYTPKWSITKDLNENIYPCDTISLLISRFNEQYALSNLLKH